MSDCPDKRSDHALRFSEARYRRLFESAQDGILLLNADTGQIEDVNPFLIKMLGYTHAEMLGKKLWEVGSFADRAESKDIFATLQATGYVRYEHIPLRTKTGSKISVEFVSNSYDCEGIKVIQCNIRDITERKLLEQTLDVTRAQMVAASRLSALGEMAGGIAHEINNPLAVIHALASDLAEQGDTAPEDVVQSAHQIAEYAERIAKIVRSLRYLAREGGADPFGEASINEIVMQTLDLCKARFHEHGIDLVTMPIDPELRINCREVQISQILVNLLQNAFDAALEQAGEKWVRLEVLAQDGRVIILVIDCGHGVPTALKERIMQPFFTTKPVGKGTGLGLSLSRQIAEQHGGTLEVSESGGHTCFCLSLPFASDGRLDCN
jgi:PAS domain S-box-containing protein